MLGLRARQRARSSNCLSQTGLSGWERVTSPTLRVGRGLGLSCALLGGGGVARRIAPPLMQSCALTGWVGASYMGVEVGGCKSYYLCWG